MAKDVVDVNLATVDAIPASLRFEHLSDEELEAALKKELEVCADMKKWPTTDRY